MSAATHEASRSYRGAGPAGQGMIHPEAGPAAAADALAAELRAAGAPERASSEKAYLKSDLEFFGVGVPAIRAVVRAWCRARPALAHDELVAVAAALWKRPVHERRMAAQMLLIQNTALLGPPDVPLIEQMLRAARTWALVDSLAAELMGALVERYPELTSVLDRWAADGDFWIRRSALLALLVPLRRGGGDFGRFSRYADQMLAEKEFFIRKAIGWVLRETAKKRPALVADWLEPRILQVSGVTLREALKPLPPATRDSLLAARDAIKATG
ncbi:MAG: DNA alkylation repair protein, partial [Streptosporangiaceae bacterium]